MIKAIVEKLKQMLKNLFSPAKEKDSIPPDDFYPLF